MFKKENTFKIIVGVGLLIGAFLLVVYLIFPRNRFEYISIRDRVNPFISQTVSYAKVRKIAPNGPSSNVYRNVQAIDKTGKKLPYKIEYIGGYYDGDNSSSYISITHKGQYVKEIRYISKKQYDKIKK